MIINSDGDMRVYILRQLGYPVINIEVSDDQLMDIVYDTVQEVQRYLIDEGAYRDYIIFTTSANVANYPVANMVDGTGNSLSALDLAGIYDFTVSFGMDGINTLFSPTHILLYNQYVEQGSYPGGPSTGSTGGLVLADYQIAMMYLDSINEMFGKYYVASWNDGLKSIYISPTPNMALTGVLNVYRKQMAINIYNNPLFKKLVVAKVKMMWGSNLKKYSLTMPDGMSINGSEIYQEGKEDWDKWFERLYDESQAGGEFWVA